MADTEELLKKEVAKSSFSLPDKAFTRSGKISRGENYNRLPYVILDYPRLFTREDTFAYRSMLWWGHEFSVTLHLSGIYLNPLHLHLPEVLQYLASDKEIFFCVHSDPWQYHFSSDNYRNLSDLISEDQISSLVHRKFIKISKKWSLEHWKDFPEHSAHFFEELLSAFVYFQIKYK